MFISEQRYKAWQQRLAEHRLFRKWWQFWSNYAVIFFIAAGVGLWQQPKAFQILVLAVVAFIISRVIVITIINLGVKRQRPYQKFSFDPITSRLFSFRTAEPNSFPSRHTTAFAGAAAVVLMFNPVVGVVLLAVTTMTGLGRIVLGYHYISDIVGGMILGVLVGVFSVYLLSPLLFT